MEAGRRTPFVEAGNSCYNYLQEGRERLMKRLLLFRFYKDPVISKNRLELLKAFNPGIDILGLYTGEEGDFPNITKALSQHLAHVYCISGKSAEWKWKHGDLATRLWYKDYGHHLGFDMLHIVEWDLLLFSSISQLTDIFPRMGLASQA